MARFIVVRNRNKYFLYDTRYFGFDSLIIGASSQVHITHAIKNYYLESWYEEQDADRRIPHTTKTKLNVVDEFDALNGLFVKYYTNRVPTQFHFDVPDHGFLDCVEVTKRLDNVSYAWHASNNKYYVLFNGQDGDDTPTEITKKEFNSLPNMLGDIQYD